MFAHANLLLAITLGLSLVTPAIDASDAPRRDGSLCLRIESPNTMPSRITVEPQDQLYLRFRHSIYGSQAEEVFAMDANGFILTELRYREARLVEFYGHDKASHRNGTWVVAPAPIRLPSLTLRLSDDAAASLQLANSHRNVDIFLQPDAAHHLAVTSCGAAVDG